jgi:cysteine desulfurase
MLLTGIPERIPHVHITGPVPAHPEVSKDGAGERRPALDDRRAANNASFCFEYIEGEAILIALDLAGVAASSGSACTSGSLEPSHVLTALGVPEDLARGSLRLTVGKDNTREQIEHVLEVLPGIVSRIRSLSPAWPERAASG